MDVLANPDVLESMSVLNEGAARFVTVAKYDAGVEEWGGLFAGLSDYADKLMKVSPSKDHGLGREQVIRFMGAVEESKMMKRLNLSLGGKESQTGESEQ